MLKSFQATPKAGCGGDQVPTALIANTYNYGFFSPHAPTLSLSIQIVPAVSPPRR